MEILKHSVGIDIDMKTFKACICLIDNSLHTKIVAGKTFDNYGFWVQALRGLLEAFLEKYMEKAHQRDDITLLGIKLGG